MNIYVATPECCVEVGLDETVGGLLQKLGIATGLDIVSVRVGDVMGTDTSAFSLTHDDAGLSCSATGLTDGCTVEVEATLSDAAVARCIADFRKTAYRSLPEVVRADRRVALGAVRTHGVSFLADLPAVLRDDAEIAEACLVRCMTLSGLSPRLSSDRDFMCGAVRSSVKNYSAACTTLQLNESFAFDAVKHHRGFFEALPEPLRQNKGFVLRALAVSQYHNSCPFLSCSAELRIDKDVILAALTVFPRLAFQLDPAAYQHREVCLTAVNLHGRFLKNVPEAFRADREIVLCAVASHLPAFEWASEALRADRAVLLAALQGEPRVFSNGDREYMQKTVGDWESARFAASVEYLEAAAPALRNDRDLILLAVQRHGAALEHASALLQNDKAIALQAVSVFRPAFAWVSDTLRGDRDVVFTVMKAQSNLRHLQRDDWRQYDRYSYFADVSETLRGERGVVLEAVKGCGAVLQYASDVLRDDKEVVLAAVSAFRPAFVWASERLCGDREVLLAAINAKESNLSWFPDNVRENNEACLLKHASEPLRGDREVVLAAVQTCGAMLQHAADELRDDKDIVLAAIHQFHPSFAHASERLRGDREVTLSAVSGLTSKNIFYLEHASPEMCADKTVVLAALQRDGRELAYASEDLKNDKEVVLCGVSDYYGARLKHVSAALRGDKEVVLAAVGHHAEGLADASEELRGDRDVVLAAVKTSGEALLHASDELRGDKGIVLAALRCFHPGICFSYASETLRADKEVILAAIATFGFLSAADRGMPRTTRADILPHIAGGMEKDPDVHAALSTTAKEMPGVHYG